LVSKDGAKLGFARKTEKQCQSFPVGQKDITMNLHGQSFPFCEGYNPSYKTYRGSAVFGALSIPLAAWI